MGVVRTDAAREQRIENKTKRAESKKQKQANTNERPANKGTLLRHDTRDKTK